MNKEKHIRVMLVDDHAVVQRRAGNPRMRETQP